MLEENSGRPDPVLCSLVSAFCEIRKDDIGAVKFRMLANGLPVVGLDSALCLLKVERTLSASPDDMMSGLQERCVEVLARSWKDLHPRIAEIENDVDPKVWAAVWKRAYEQVKDELEEAKKRERFWRERQGVLPVRIQVVGAGYPFVDGEYELGGLRRLPCYVVVIRRLQNPTCDPVNESIKQRS